MDVDEYLRHDGVGLAQLVRAGVVSPTDLLDTALAVLDRRNPSLNAVTAVLDGFARDNITRGLPDGPFRGVPYLLKDLTQQLTGTVTTGSCRVLTGHVAERDSTLTARLRSAGLLIFGKTNTPELGLSMTTEPALFGPTRNPWDLTRTAGGSSGGAAAAVAAGIVPMAQASDSGGSIRIPASCCGLVGLKPTRGRVPLGPDLFEMLGGTTTAHAVTRSVRDCAALLDATAGSEPDDPHRCRSEGGGFLEEVGRAPGVLRIAVMATPYSGDVVHPEVRAGLDTTVRLLESLGHHLEPARPSLDGAALPELVQLVFGAHVSVLLDRAAARRGRAWQPAEVEPATSRLICRARSTGSHQYAAAVEVFQHAARAAARFHQRWDVLLSPTLAAPPLPLGALADGDADPAAGAWQAGFRFSPFTVVANVTGQPSLSLPLASSPADLPIGMMLTAAAGREALLLRLGAQIETAAPWPLLADAGGPVTTRSRLRVTSSWPHVPDATVG
jgi:amidase